MCAQVTFSKMSSALAVQSLNLVLLIDAEHQRVLRRVEREAYDIFQLGGEIRIAADLEALDVVRLQSMRSLDSAHAGLRDSRLTRHRAARPLRSVARRCLRGLGDDLGNFAGGDRRPAAGSRRVLQ